MGDKQIIVIVAGIILLLGWLSVVYKRKQRARWLAKEHFPVELQTATLWASEKAYFCRRPVPLHGVMDQVYRTLKNELVIVDTKTHQGNRVYPSDKLQLSVYRTILLHPPGLIGLFVRRKVSAHGYIRQENAGDVKYLRVELLDENAVIAAYHQYRAITRGRRAAEKRNHPALCNACGYKAKCP